MVVINNRVTTSKLNNRSKILHIIGDKKIARKDLAKLVKLTPAAISIITKGLINEGVIIETSEQAITKSVGRKKTFIKINKNYKYIFGIAIETDSITISVANMFKEILLTVKHRYDDPSWDEVKLLINTEVNYFISELKLTKDMILGVGLGIVGIVDSINGISKKAIGLWKDEIDVVTELESMLDMDIVIDNNVRVLALAEMEKRDYNNNLIFVKYGPGIGASLILDGEIYSGNSFNALEFGHCIIDPLGKPCYCGQNGCLETIGSYISIKDELIKNYSQTQELKDITNGSVKNINTQNILKAYNQNDAYVVKTVEKSLEYFSLGLYNLIKILDIKEFIISGVFFKDTRVFSRLKQLVDSYGNMYSMRLKQSVLDDNKSIGGISLARKELFLDTGADKGEINK